MHSIADIVGGFILVALAATLVGSKETKGIVGETFKGFSGSLKAAEGH
jgi:uncharacterized membrane protein YeaQ/YmgE (transglycosylase-associated protein family)